MGDGRVDLFLLRGDSDRPIAVQAKRNSKDRRIGIEDIDRFIGSLVRHDIADGLFVTTSAFTRGALEAASADALKKRSIYLDLWDASRLLAALQEGVQSAITPVDVAWEIRELLPVEWDKTGDYYGPEEWPVEERSVAHMEWWSLRIAEIVRGSSLDRSKTVEVLPETMGVDAAKVALERYKGERVEVLYINKWKLQHEEHKSKLSCAWGWFFDYDERTVVVNNALWKGRPSGVGSIVPLESIVRIIPRSVSFRGLASRNCEKRVSA